MQGLCADYAQSVRSVRIRSWRRIVESHFGSSHGFTEAYPVALPPRIIIIVRMTLREEVQRILSCELEQVWAPGRRTCICYPLSHNCFTMSTSIVSQLFHNCQINCFTMFHNVNVKTISAISFQAQNWQRVLGPFDENIRII